MSVNRQTSEGVNMILTSQVVDITPPLIYDEMRQTQPPYGILPQDSQLLWRQEKTTDNPNMREILQNT